jgi:hypothetical protein
LRVSMVGSVSPQLRFSRSHELLDHIPFCYIH